MASGVSLNGVLVLLILGTQGVHGATLTDVTISGDTDGYFFMSDTECSIACCAQVTVNLGSGSGTFKIEDENPTQLLQANVNIGDNVIDMSCTDFGTEPGMYTVTMTVTIGSDTYSKVMVAVWEETLVGYSVTASQLIAPPYTNIAFDMAVNSGTNALFTVDCVTNIQLMKSCDGNTRNATYTQMFNDTGSHVITTMVSNYGSKLSETVVITIIHNMNDVTITADNLKPQSNEDPGMKVTMGSTAELPMGNLTGWHTCTADGSQTSLDLSSLNAQDTVVAITCPCNGQGNKTVTVNVSTELDTLEEVYNIYCWDILNVTISLEKDVQPIDDIVPFIVENSPNYGMQWSIDACQGITLENTNPTNYDSLYTVNPFDMSTIRYSEVGNCTLHATFWNEMYIVVLDLSFELSIGVNNLTAEPSALEILTGDTFTIVVNATGLDIFWAVDFTEAMVVQDGCSGLVAEHNFSAAGIYDIEVMASNKVNNKSLSLTVVVANPINGYTVSTTAPLIQSHEDLVIDVALDTNADTPMGNLTINISPCGTEDFTASLAENKGGSDAFNCNFTVQGNYTVNVTIASTVSSESFILEIAVCDNLAIEIGVEKTAWAVDDTVTVTMTSLPISGFKYDIDMGDGSTTHTDQTDAILLSPNAFTEIPTITYSAPGTYNISFVGSNPCYSVASTVSIGVFYGIPDCNLDLTPVGTLVSPDHTAKFAFVTKSGTTTNNPTSVTCSWNLGDGTPVVDQPTDMDFSTSSKGYEISHDYTTEGTLNYQIDCENLVSNLSFTGTVDVVLVTATAFVVTNDPVIALDEGSCTPFDITIDFHSLTYVPQSVTYTVDYDDASGVSPATDLTSYTVSKNMCTRGDYSGQFIVTYDSATNPTAINYKLGTCKLELVGSETNGIVDDTSFAFTLTNNLAGESITVVIDWKDGQTDNQIVGAGAFVTVNHVFATHGYKTPTYSTTQNPTSVGGDTASLDKELYLMYPVADLVLEITEPILLGVAIEPIIEYTGSNFLMNLTCNITYDATASEILTGVDLDSTTTSTTATGNAYMSIQEETVFVECKNPLTSLTLNKTFEVSSDCFEAPDIFESIHRKINTPFRAYMSALPTLTAKVKLTPKCQNTTEFKFEWSFKKLVIGTADFENYTIATPNKISMNLATSTIVEGFYLVQLYMFLVERPGDYLRDKQYMQLVNPPLVCKNEGGDYITVGKNEELVLDASTNSYDPLTGVNVQGGLDFTWACYKVPNCNDTLPYTVPKSTDKSYQSREDCGLTLPDDGFIRVDLSPLAADSCYVFEQTSSKDSRNCSAIQIADVKAVAPCKIAIMCKKNCMQKVTPEEMTSFEVNIVCDGATQEQLDAAIYSWTLLKFDSGTGVFTEMTWGPQFIRGRGDKFFELVENTFEAGSSYRLQVTASAAGRPEGMGYITLVGNEKPRGSDCKMTPDEGVFLNTTFSLLCDNWMDEGIRDARDDSIDASEPLTLRIIQDQKLISTIPFTRKVSISQIDLAIGDEANDYNTTMEFEVVDMFGGKKTFTQIVKYRDARPALPPYGTAAETSNMTAEEQAEAQKAFEDFLQVANSTVGFTEATGDPLQTAITIAIFAKSINSITAITVSAEDVNTVTNENADSEMAKTLEAGTEQNPFEEKIKQVNELFMTTLNDKIEEELTSLASSSKTPSIATITVFANAMTSAASNPQFSTKKSVEAAGNVLLILSKVLLSARNQSLSISQAEDMRQAVGSLLEAVINCNSDYGVLGVDVEDADDLANTTTTEEGFNAVEADYLKKLLKRKEELRLKYANSSLSSNIDSITLATENIFKLAQSLTTDNATTTMEKTTYIQSVAKATAGSMKSSPKELNGSAMSVEDIEVDRDGDILEQNMAVLKENPYVIGNNAKMAEHGVTVAYITKNGKKIKLKGAAVTKTDPIEAPYVYVASPEFVSDDPGYFFYHRFTYRSKQEQICITVKPMDKGVCYDICLRAIIAPTEFEFDHCVRNVTGSIGYEYCAPAASCKRAGICWLGIAPFPCDDTIENPPAHRRVKRAAPTNSTGITTPAPVLSNPNSTYNSSNFLLSPYWLRVITLSCLSWDGAERDWRADQCTVSRDGNSGKTKCSCGDREDMVTTVSFFVAPNKIDFSTVFSKFDIAGQGAVLGTILVIFVLFVIFLFWGRYMDGQDVLQWGVTLLEDNYRQDEYFYLITVHTGMVRHGGTKSKIGFCIAGEEDDSGVRCLTDGVREEMKAGSTMHFLMAVPQCLGTLQCFRVWHDSSGKGDSASWYLNRIEVTDLQTSDKYDFLCYQWMALEEGVLDRALPLSSTENMKNFKTMFFEHARHHLTDDHLWVSVVLRPVKSHFSRVQRIGCCYALLMLAMIANAMFFQSKSNKDRQQKGADFSIGPISFSLSQIYISFISTIITAVPVFFIMLLFRKSKLSEKATKDGARLWMPKCFRNFKFYKQSKAIEKIMVIRDIVDDQDGVLPHFCVYISWVFAFVCVVVSAFFIMLYSMEWGKDISEEWLVTFILSFFESLILLDPVKVLVLAILFALLLKTLKASKPSSFDLNHIKRMVHELGIIGEGRARMDYRSPFSEEELLAAKTNCRRRNTMKKAVQELLTNSFFLILLCSITYSNRDPLGFTFHQNIDNTFMSPFRPAVTLKHVNTTEHYFRWLNETVIPNMFPKEGFNGTSLPPNMRLRISDLANYRVGPPRLRQVRTAAKPCNIPYIGPTACYPIYDLATEENRNWCQGWRSQPPCPEHQALDVTNAAWTFVSALSIWGLPISGHMNVYGGGGYIANLDISRQVANMAYDELYRQRWIDRHTRAVFLEFTLYNVNRNMFCYVSILAEFPETGGVVEFTNVYPFRSYNHLGTIGKYILVCEIVFFVFSMAWLGYIVFRLTKERWTFFKSFWNIVELVTVVMSFIAIVLYFVRLTYTDAAMAAFKDNDREFVNFYHIAAWDSMFIYVLAFLVMTATLRLLKVMGYSRVTQIVYIVLKESSKTLPGFFFYIMLILAAYGLLGYMVFGKTSYAYKDPVTTMETLFSAVLGHAGFRNTNVPASDTWITLIYFVSFIMIVVFALSNIFMTILLDTLSMVGDDPKNLNYKEIELFAYMWDSAKTLITGKKEPRGLDTSKGGPALDEKQEPPFMVGGFGFGGLEAHERKLQMKMDMAAAVKPNANKPSYKY